MDFSSDSDSGNSRLSSFSPEPIPLHLSFSESDFSPARRTGKRLTVAERHARDMADIASLFSVPARPLSLPSAARLAALAKSRSPSPCPETANDSTLNRGASNAGPSEPSSGRVHAPRAPPSGNSTMPGPKRQKTAKTKKPSTAKPSTAKTRNHFTAEHTEALMVIFDQCKADSLLDGPKKSEWWEEAAEQLFDQFGVQFATQTIRRKYDKERTRYKYWKALEEYPGTTYDEATQLLVCDSPERWEEFKENYEGRQSLDWLRTTPLGNLGIYRRVFSLESAALPLIPTLDDLERASAHRASAGSRFALEKKRKREEMQSEASNKRSRGDGAALDVDGDDQVQVLPVVQTSHGHGHSRRARETSSSRLAVRRTRREAARDVECQDPSAYLSDAVEHFMIAMMTAMSARIVMTAAQRLGSA